MKYPVHVFMGSDKDMKFAEPVFSDFDLFGIPYTKDIVSGEKANEDCRGRVKEYDQEGRGAYLSIVGMGNTMGPVINGSTRNPAVTMPVGSTDELKFYIGSSVGRPGDSPLITVIGDGKAAATFMDRIMGLHDKGVRRKICDKRGIKYIETTDAPSAFYIYHSDFPVNIAGSIDKKFQEFLGDSVLASYYSRKRPLILISDFSNSKVNYVQRNNDFPIIVTPTYGSKEISKLREDVDKFIEGGGLPVGLVVSPENAALASLRIMGMGDEALSEKLKQYTEKLQDQYRKKVA